MSFGERHNRRCGEGHDKIKKDKVDRSLNNFIGESYILSTLVAYQLYISQVNYNNGMYVHTSDQQTVLAVSCSKVHM